MFRTIACVGRTSILVSRTAQAGAAAGQALVKIGTDGSGRWGFLAGRRAAVSRAAESI